MFWKYVVWIVKCVGYWIGAFIAGCASGVGDLGPAPKRPRRQRTYPYDKTSDPRKGQHK
ncbi:hypothetical protein [Rhodococcus sp. 14-2483-1-2]|uniref:hypothetical protein n=1 Tax=Rhodococcus sp. 14-2483-1-2 TaxID=2023147 RepID=UPI001482AB25|nr:hypothetical protein [Rhodococcus sp. 14-2483-1-2]